MTSDSLTTAFSFDTIPTDGDYVFHDAETGAQLQVRLSGFNAASDNVTVLPVFFSGAVSDRGSKTGPFFSGERIASNLKVPMLAIADPLVSDSNSLGLAWYTGSIKRPAQKSIVSFLNQVHEAWKLDEFLLIGGSGGGFAALQTAYALGTKCSALVWNPQTDIFKYDTYFVRKYLAEALGDESDKILNSPDWKELSKFCLNRHEISSDLLSNNAEIRPDRILYLQNASDWHLRAHALPFLDKNCWLQYRQGIHCNGLDHVLWVAPFGLGHAIPSRATLEAAISQMLQRDVAPALIVENLTKLPEFHNIDWNRNPTRLQEINIHSSDVSLSARRIPCGVRVDLKKIPFAEAVGGVTADVYSIRDNAVISSEGQLPIKRSTLTSSSSQTTEEVRVDFRDGFGQRFLSRRVPVQQDIVPRVLILGSCVSRDPMELENAPKLVDYIARTSLAGALARPPAKQETLIKLDSIVSKFQRRMVQIDFRKSLRELLVTQDFDVLLLDIIDERLALIEVNDGIVTASPEASRGGFVHTAGRRIEWGSHEHKRLWLAGLRELIELVGRSRIIINQVYWASSTPDGEPIEGQERISAANERLDAYYALMRSEHLKNWITYDPDELIADPHHKWGLSPFHYPIDTQRRVVEYLR